MSRDASRTRPRRRRGGPSRIGAVLAVASALSVAGCSDNATESDGQGGITKIAAMGHVHGLGVDPADGALYVATHLGVFRVAEGQTPERVADRAQDTMGFSVIGPGRFLGSGHPDLREDLPSSLGLIESNDGAQTWDTVSLVGDADLHAIEPVGDRIYAYDSHTGSLITTTNRTDWDTISVQPLYDLAAQPGDPATVYATTDTGVLVQSANNAEPVDVPHAPVLTAIDWEPGGPLVGVAPDGAIMVTDDPTVGNWREVGTLDGPAEALDTIGGRWHAATESGVYESTDGGATWSTVITIGHG